MNAITLALVTRSFYNQVWAVTPEMYGVMESIVLERIEGYKPSTDEIKARVDGKTYGSSGDAGTTNGTEIAVINLHGVMMSRIQAMESLSGGSTPQRFAQAVRNAADDPSVGTIVISIDSPGGAVSGTGVAAEAVAYAASRKRTIAVIDDMAASAAYWIASQASEIVIPTSGTAGSISVIMAHVDRREQYAKAGVKPTILRSGQNKALGQDVEALTPAIRAKLEADMQKYHDLFVSAVASGRGRTPENVQANWADGSTFVGQEAVDAGLADRIGTLASVLAELQATDEDPADTGSTDPNIVLIGKGSPGLKVNDDTENEPSPPADPPEEGDQTPAPVPPPLDPAPQENAMNIADITAKLTSGQPLNAEERAFLNTHLDAQGAGQPAASDMSKWPPEARAAMEAMNARLTTTDARAQVAEKMAAAERDVRLNAEYEGRALALGQPAAFGATLRKLHETDAEAATATESALRTAHAQVRLTAEIGGAGARPGAADPQAQIEARARELADGGMKADAALTQAMTELSGPAAAYYKEVR